MVVRAPTDRLTSRIANLTHLQLGKVAHYAFDAVLGSSRHSTLQRALG